MAQLSIFPQAWFLFCRSGLTAQVPSLQAWSRSTTWSRVPVHCLRFDAGRALATLLFWCPSGPPVRVSLADASAVAVLRRPLMDHGRGNGVYDLFDTGTAYHRNHHDQQQHCALGF
ncbi:hypothetical protein B0H66DRAFT_156864 [Apodospora peruviana]|uniref:Secreted protein n=1 Tax=Apodospora peruviana TaxID=516989 RepID=A0AAE0MCV0_9PEZI|nr:hypothetical protein B0H66DRAFT_156864 [Apodospora peruviana]